MTAIRPVRLADAEKFGVLQDKLDRETRYMLMEPGEISISVEEWERRIAPFVTASSSMFWVAENDLNELVGFIRVRGNAARRLSHSAVVVIGIQKAYWGHGLGSRLFEQLDGWAPAQGISRLELTVMVANLRAIALYHKWGFVVEGLRRRSIHYADGTWADEYTMAKIF